MLAADRKGACGAEKRRDGGARHRILRCGTGKANDAVQAGIGGAGPALYYSDPARGRRVWNTKGPYLLKRSV